MTPQHEQDMRVLEYIYDSDGPDSSGSDMGGLYALVGDQQALTSAVSLKQSGLIRDALRMSGGYHMTAQGRARVEETRARRNDRAYRRRACRDQFLRWVDSECPIASSRATRDAFTGSVDLLPFTEDDTAAAAQYLIDNGLLESVTSAWGKPHVVVKITELGRECADSGIGIGDFIEQRNRAGVGNTINMGGSGNIYSNAIGDHSTATANVVMTQPELLAQLAEAVRQMQPVLNLPAAETEAALRDIEATDDPSRVQRGLNSLAALSGQVSTGAVGGLLSSYLAGQWGIGS